MVDLLGQNIYIWSFNLPLERLNLGLFICEKPFTDHEYFMRKWQLRSALFRCAFTGVVLTSLSTSIAQVTPPPSPSAPAAQGDAADAGRERMKQLGLAMVTQLRGVEGCLNAEAATMSGSRFVIFAWFKDKAAATRWYRHPMHAGLQAASGQPQEADVEPLAGVPEGVPIMAVAAIAFDGPPASPGSKIPFSSIAIELYSPLKQSLYVNKGMAPDGFFDLPNKLQTTPDAKGAPTTRPSN